MAKATHYGDSFFDYVDSGALQSARLIVGRLFAELHPNSVLDVGCGRGGWLLAWESAGCSLVAGIDGSYVDRSRLHCNPDAFREMDLDEPFDLGRRFDLVQCLEVAEHICPARSETLIDSIVRHGDVILFSAAVPGQGGTGHVNEHPLDYWRGLFRARGYAAFDPLRPRVHTDRHIEPWYRFNTIIYVDAAGSRRLPRQILDTRVPDQVPLADFSPWPWRARKAVLRPLPVGVIDWMAAINARGRRLLRS